MLTKMSLILSRTDGRAVARPCHRRWVPRTNNPWHGWESHAEVDELCHCRCSCAACRQRLAHHRLIRRDVLGRRAERCGASVPWSHRTQRHPRPATTKNRSDHPRGGDGSIDRPTIAWWRASAVGNVEQSRRVSRRAALRAPPGVAACIVDWGRRSRPATARSASPSRPGERLYDRSPAQPRRAWDADRHVRSPLMSGSGMLTSTPSSRVTFVGAVIIARARPVDVGAFRIVTGHTGSRFVDRQAAIVKRRCLRRRPLLAGTRCCPRSGSDRNGWLRLAVACRRDVPNCVRTSVHSAARTDRNLPRAPRLAQPASVVRPGRTATGPAPRKTALVARFPLACPVAVENNCVLSDEDVGCCMERPRGMGSPRAS